MTTKVTIACQEDSHWHVKITTQDRQFDFNVQKITDEWREAPYATVVLKQGETHETYIHHTRRLVVEEVVALLR